METVAYNSGSSLHRQDTFQTDPRFAARSKSGSVRKGNLSLPVIGPRHLIRHKSADRNPSPKPQRRERSVERTSERTTRKPFSLVPSDRKTVLTDKTYTKSLVGPVKQNKQLNGKTDEKVKLKTTTVKSKEVLNDEINRQTQSNNNSLNIKRQTDTKSVDSGDSLKENKLTGTKGLHRKHAKSPVNLKESKSADELSSKDTKKDESLALKKTKPERNNPLKSNDTEREHKQEPKEVSKRTQLLRVTNNKVNDSSETNDKSVAPKVRKRETLRDKLTSTPISDFTSEIKSKPHKPKSVVHVKEIQSESGKQKGFNKQTPGSVAQSTKVVLPEYDKSEKQNNKKKSDTDSDDLKSGALKNINSKREKVKKESPELFEKRSLKQRQNLSINERKHSSGSIESGFASYRKSKELDDAISILSLTETEVGKPPENTLLDRPRSDKSRVSVGSNHPVSEKLGTSKANQRLVEDKILENTLRQRIETKKSGQGVVSGDNKSSRNKHSHSMEPAVQRKPGFERMTETYESIYEERRTLLEAEVAYKRRIKQLEDEMNQFLRTIEDLRSENKALRSRIDSLESASQSGNDNEKEQLKLTIKSLETQNKMLGTKLDNAENELEKLKPERDKLTSESKEIAKKLSEVQEKYDNMSGELEKLKSNGDGGTAKLEKEINQLHTELRAEQAERKKLDDENTILKTDKDVLKDEISALRSINKNLEAMNEELKTDNPTDLASSEKMELKSQIIKLQTENQTLNEENIKLKAENLKQVKSIHDLEKTAKSFESSVTAVESTKLTEIQDLKNENAKLKSEIKDLKETYADVENKIKTLENQNKELDETLTQKKTELSELMSALKEDDKFENEIKALKAENIRLQKNVEEKDTKAEVSSKRLEEIKLEKDKFETEKNKLSEKINDMLRINEAQKKQMADIQSNLDLAKKENESNKDKLKHVEKFETEIAELTSQLQEAEQEKANLMKKKQEEVEALKLKMDRNSADHKEQIDAIKFDYEKQIDELKQQVEFLQKEIDELRQLKAVESELLETKDELRSVKEKYSQMISEVEEKSDIEQKNFQLNVRMTQMNNTIKQLEREQRDWLIKKQEFEEIEADNKRLQEENTQFKQKGGARRISNKIDRQLELLERKQKDAETRVKQLEGWVGDIYDDENQNKATYVGSLNTRKTTQPRKKAFTKAPKLQQTTIRVENERPRSLDDVVVKEKVPTERSERSDKLSHRSSPILPAIQPETRLTFGLGYSQIHRNRINAAQKYKKS